MSTHDAVSDAELHQDANGEDSFLAPDVLRSVWELGGLVGRQSQGPELFSVLAHMRSRVDGVLRQPGLAQPLQVAARSYPRNWRGVDFESMDMFHLARDEGLPLLWAPGRKLVAELLRAPDAEVRRDLLATHLADIVADCAAVVGEVQHAALRVHRVRLLEATRAHQAGLHGPGQAMSAVVITALLQRVYPPGDQAGKVAQLKQIKSSSWRVSGVLDGETSLRVLKVAMLMEAAVKAVEGGRDRLPDSALKAFNRHDTLHRVSAEAYAPCNAMTALLLATGLLVEAEQLLEEGWLTVPLADSPS